MSAPVRADTSLDMGVSDWTGKKLLVRVAATSNQFSSEAAEISIPARGEKPSVALDTVAETISQFPPVIRYSMPFSVRTSAPSRYPRRVSLVPVYLLAREPAKRAEACDRFMDKMSHFTMTFQQRSPLQFDSDTHFLPVQRQDEQNPVITRLMPHKFHFHSIFLPLIMVIL